MAILDGAGSIFCPRPSMYVPQCTQCTSLNVNKMLVSHKIKNMVETSVLQEHDLRVLYNCFMEQKDKNSICCPEFNPKKFEEKTHVWKDKLFLQDEVRQIIHIPLNMERVVKRMFAKIESAKAMPGTADFLMLCHDPSPWKSEIYMTVTKNVPEGKMAKLTGTFLSKVFDGPYNGVPGWIKDMDAYVAGKGKNVKKYYFHFAYCPKCAKKFRHNYAIAFAQV